MSFVSTQPEALTAAAGTLQGIGSPMSAQNAAAAPPTTGVVPAAADEVSALTAAQLAAHAQMYQAWAPTPGGRSGRTGRHARRDADANQRDARMGAPMAANPTFGFRPAVVQHPRYTPDKGRGTSRVF